MNTDPRSPFLWQGKPSIFSTDKDRANFVGSNYGRSVNVSAIPNRVGMALPGGSKNLPPELIAGSAPWPGKK